MAIIQTIICATEHAPGKFILRCTACAGQHALGAFDDAESAAAAVAAHRCDPIEVAVRPHLGGIRAYEITVRGAVLILTEMEAMQVAGKLSQAIYEEHREHHDTADANLYASLTGQRKETP